MDKYLIYMVLAIIIVFNASQRIEEPFIPKIIKESYRPLERNIKQNVEGFYSKTTANVSNFLRKFHIL